MDKKKTYDEYESIRETLQYEVYEEMLSMVEKIIKEYLENETGYIAREITVKIRKKMKEKEEKEVLKLKNFNPR